MKQLYEAAIIDSYDDDDEETFQPVLEYCTSDNVRVMMVVRVGNTPAQALPSPLTLAFSTACLRLLRMLP